MRYRVYVTGLPESIEVSKEVGDQVRHDVERPDGPAWIDVTPITAETTYGVRSSAIVAIVATPERQYAYASST